MRQRVKLNTVGVLRFRAPEGPATAVTGSLYDQTGTLVTSSAAAASPLSTTTNGAVSARDQSVTIVLATGALRGTHAWIGTTSSEPRELVQIDSRLSLVCQLTEPLRYAHATGVGFVGADWTWTLAAGNFDTLGVYRVDWDYTVDGDTFALSDVIEVVTRVTRIPITLADVRAQLPTELRRGPSELQDEALVLAGADRVLEDLEAKGFKVDRVRDTSQLIQPAVHAVGLLLAQRWAAYDPDEGGAAEDRAGVRYEQALRRALEASLTWYDADSDGVPDAGGELGVADYTYLHDRRVGEAL